jgi:rhodanese-related sulfurtransferase
MADMSTQPNVPVVSVSDLPDDAVMVDVRERGEWVAGHAPEAVLIPMGDLPSQIEELPLGDGPLAVVCRSGNRSGRVVAWLSQQGIDAVNVAGGMQAWDAAGKPMVADVAGPARVV